MNGSLSNSLLDHVPFPTAFRKRFGPLLNFHRRNSVLVTIRIWFLHITGPKHPQKEAAGSVHIFQGSILSASIGLQLHFERNEADP